MTSWSYDDCSLFGFPAWRRAQGREKSARHGRVFMVAEPRGLLSQGVPAPFLEAVGRPHHSVRAATQTRTQPGCARRAGGGRVLRGGGGGGAGGGEERSLRIWPVSAASMMAREEQARMMAKAVCATYGGRKIEAA